MGSSAWAVFALGKNGTEVNEDLIETLDGSPDSKDSVNLDVVFHEFLHFAKFDNLSPKRHNNLGKYGLQPHDDLVYSCTGAVFPKAPGDYFQDPEIFEKARTFCRDFNP